MINSALFSSFDWVSHLYACQFPKLGSTVVVQSSRTGEVRFMVYTTLRAEWIG